MFHFRPIFFCFILVLLSHFLFSCAWDDTYYKYLGDVCPPIQTAEKCATDGICIMSDTQNYHTGAKRCRTNYLCRYVNVTKAQEEENRYFENYACVEKCEDESEVRCEDIKNHEISNISDGEGLNETEDSVINRICVDLSSNVDHCGMCKKRCPTFASCIDGECRCAEGLVVCNNTCINPKIDSEFCGASKSCQLFERGVKCAENESCINGICIKYDCPNNVCKSNWCTNDIEHCGKYCVSCLELPNSKAVECDESSGSCKITECNEGYHLSSLSAGNACVANSNTSCGLATGIGQDCTIPVGVKNVICNAGSCQIQSCNDGFHIKDAMNSACEPNTNTACTTPSSNVPDNCNTIISNASVTSCVAGTCKVEMCNDNYHILNSDKSACEINSYMFCAPPNSFIKVNCNTTISNSLSTECSSGSCIVTKCYTNHHIGANRTTCIANSPQKCASITALETVDCYQSIPNSEITDCVQGTCRVTVCSQNHYLNANGSACLNTSNTACASTSSSSPQDCTKIPNAQTTACSSDGNCIVQKCRPNYHIFNAKACRQNSDSNCGPQNGSSVDCRPDNKCVNGACVPK